MDPEWRGQAEPHLGACRGGWLATAPRQPGQSSTRNLQL